MNKNDMPPSRPTSGRLNATSAQDTTLHSEPVTNSFGHLIKPFNFEDMANLSAIPEEEAARRQAEAEDNSPFGHDDMPPSDAPILKRQGGGTRKNRNSKQSKKKYRRSKRSSRRSKRSSRRSKQSSRRSRR
jgi:hypothetical protein